MKVNFYLNMPSFYQEDLIKSLSTFCKVKVYYEGDLSIDRKKLGWNSELNGYDYVFEKNISLKEMLFLDKEAFHIISGFPGGLKNFLRYVLFKEKRKILFQCEFPANFRKLSLFHLGAIIFSKFVKKNNNIILGIANKIREYWKDLGIPEEQIIAWAYFVNDKKEHLSIEIRNTKNFDYSKIEGPILFAGQLVRRKNVKLLLEAYNIVKQDLINNLVILGQGEEAKNLKLLAKKLGIENRVKFLGSKTPKEIHNYLEISSVLILPSKYDGWGVIVNEAILNDTPVIVSDRVGAREIVKKFNVGEIFEEGNVFDLSKKLVLLLKNKDKYYNYSMNCKNAKNKISISNANKYLLYILNRINQQKDIYIRSIWDFSREVDE